MKLDTLRRMVKDREIEFLDLKFCDLPGRWHHLTLPASSLKASLFSDGVGVDGSSVPGWASIERGDMIMRPDPATAFVDPFFERPTLSMIGNIVATGKKMEPYSRDPRRVAADAERFLAKTLKGSTIVLGPEFEFYVFDRVNFFQGSAAGFYELYSDEAQWHPGEDEENLGYKIPYKKGYHAAPPRDRTYNLRSEICALLADVGIPIKYHHHEVGGGGQHEIEVDFDTLLRMADKSMLVKYVVKNYTFSQNQSATFMPKPLFDEPGSGLHVHQYLAGAGGSLFYGKTGPAQLSELGRHYIGGLLKHVDSMVAFSNPSTNSFKRLIPGFEAPVAGTYSVANRTACVRIPGYQRDPKTMRIEFRTGDGTMNAYLAYAAMLMAGLDGIRNKIDPGLPLDKNLDAMSAEALARIHHLPASLEEALDALEADHDYLLKGGVFTEDLVESWVAIKRREILDINKRPTPYEFERYYDA
ncbi:MAG TPA: type I glutamate--ammonia ligase [Acidobacteriota bacterium]|nr:type I glutamate--ammonia ligase [Acidobacteriota bacterium]